MFAPEANALAETVSSVEASRPGKTTEVGTDETGVEAGVGVG